MPLGTADYSAYLIQAKAFGPQVLINVMGGGDQVSSLKQFVQFGMNKDMALGGALFEIESVRSVPSVRAAPEGQATRRDGAFWSSCVIQSHHSAGLA